MDYDRVLIEQSLAKQYGVLPSEQEELSFPDWSKMVGGLMDDTPLGRVVGVRSEKDKDVIKNMGTWQKQIRADWGAFRLLELKQNPIKMQQTENEVVQLQKALMAAFS